MADVSSDEDQETVREKDIEVVIGTYEHFLIGYKVKIDGVSNRAW